MSFSSGDATRIDSLVSEMRSMVGLVLPSNLTFSKNAKRLYFIDNGAAKGPELCYANLNDDGTVHEINIRWTSTTHMQKLTLKLARLHRTP
jgi:hypothetical protein